MLFQLNDMIIQMNLRKDPEEPIFFGYCQIINPEIENLIYSFIIESHQRNHALT
jgi:hypothetical protein